ncbi:MAG TPA: hypothetical protein VFV27_11435, partial [Nevskiaceae bacterium]|nr:hypothetical protein [Nevskiaceae bacterium]
MKRYRYRALDGEGHSRDGVLETADERQALEELGRRGLIPLALDAERAAPVAKTALPWRRTRPALD